MWIIYLCKKLVIFLNNFLIIFFYTGYISQKRIEISLYGTVATCTIRNNQTCGGTVFYAADKPE